MTHMIRPACRAAGLAVVLTGLVAALPAVAADTDERCRKYADKAAKQNAENTRLNCGYGGNRWSDSRKAHVNWCRSVGGNARELREQHQERDLLLDKCRTGGKPNKDSKKEGEGRNRTTVDDEKIDKRCRKYAKKAVQQNAAALRNRCGFDGNRWSDSQKEHYRWCRSVGGNAGQIKAQTKERANMIANCKSRK